MGAALVSDNLVANKDGTAELRRGLAAAGTSLGIVGSGYILGMFSYQNRLLCLTIGSPSGSLFYDSTGTFNWVSFINQFSPNSVDPYFAAIEANKNMYLIGLSQISGAGANVFKLSAYNSEPILAGVPPGLDGSGVLAGSGTGFLGSDEQCAYQIVFGYVDTNGNLLLGNPTPRISIVNQTGGSDNVTLTFSVPQGLTTNYFYQIYRTPQTTFSATPSLNVPPGAEPQLAAQANLTSGQLSAFQVTVTDVTTDALLGAALYTNPSQEGALQTNDQPPFAADACLFSQMMFYANLVTRRTAEVSLISVGAPNGIQIGDTITVNGVVFTGAASQNNAAQQFAIVTTGTVAQNIDTTTRNLVSCININAGATGVYAFYISGANQLPGLIEFEGVYVIETAGNFSVISSRGAAFSPVLPSSGTGFTLTNDTLPNGIYVSKLAQPEATPAVNLIFVGGGDQPILRVLPLQDRVIVLKTDGVFVITGTTPSTLSITLLDSTIICIGKSTARLLNNSVYCLSQQGVVSVTASGVTIQSRAIESDLLSLTALTYTRQPFSTIANSIAYESERLYILMMPSVATDTYGTQAFCYNWITNAWTRWPIAISTGLVNPADNKLYCGMPLNQNAYIYQERKNYLYTDFMDDQFPVTITGVTGLVVSLSSTPLTAWIGYGLDQTNAGIAIITAVDTVHNTVTVSLQLSTTPNSAIPWVAGAATIDVPIPGALTYCPITAGFAHYMKNWSRINYWINNGNLALINVGFISDITGPGITQYLQANTIGAYGFGPYGPNPYGGSYNFPQAIQTLVTTNESFSHWIEPVITISFPQVRLSCLGVSITYDIVADATG